MVTLIQKEEAERIMAPYMETLERIMVESLKELNTAMDATTEEWTARAKSTTLHSLAIGKVRRYWGENKDVHIKSKYQSLQIAFNRQLVGRVKKVDGYNMSANAKTNRNDSILTHQYQLFPEVNQLTFIDLGYKIDPSWTTYDKLVIVCRYGDSIEWVLPIGNADSSKFTTLPAAPIFPTVQEEKQIKIKKA